MKITVIGAGAVGATAADNIARKSIAEELVILDIKEGIAEGKAQDLLQTQSLLGFSTNIVGSTNDYSATKNSDIVVITSGVPRKPGMTREELIGVNAGIVKSVCENTLQVSPNAIIIMVSNPMDTMTYLAWKSMGLPKNKIIGMGGILDSSRFKYQISQHHNCNQNDLEAYVIGGHGDTTMIPILRLAKYKNELIEPLLKEDDKKPIIEKTMKGGAILTGLLGTSAWYAPGAAIACLTESIVKDQNKLFTCSIPLESEYGHSNICIGVPVKVGKTGWNEIVDFNLTEEEKSLFKKSAVAVNNMNEVLEL